MINNKKKKKRFLLLQHVLGTDIRNGSYVCIAVIMSFA